MGSISIKFQKFIALTSKNKVVDEKKLVQNDKLIPATLFLQGSALNSSNKSRSK